MRLRTLRLGFRLEPRPIGGPFSDVQTGKAYDYWKGHQKDLGPRAPVARRDRIVVSTLRCGRSNLGSNPSHGIVETMARQGVCVLLFLLSPVDNVL